MIRLNRPVVVEGRYDRIRLSSIIDGVIIETGGFRIFRDRELLAGLRQIAKTRGLIVMTDSDAAGFKIRNFLKGALGEGAKLTHVYIPAVSGTERRKRAPSSEGLLGVEGLSQEMLLAALERAGVTSASVDRPDGPTRSLLYDLGLIGQSDSSARRRRLLCELLLPPRLSVNAMLSLLSGIMTAQELIDICRRLWPEAY